MHVHECAAFDPTHAHAPCPSVRLGKSYKKLFTDPSAKVQDEVLFAFNDHWATFDEQYPPIFNVVANSDNVPVTNVTNGVFPSPANIWVMNTATHTVGLFYDEAAIPGTYMMHASCRPTPPPCTMIVYRP
jgi:hypothetical protein